MPEPSVVSAGVMVPREAENSTTLPDTGDAFSSTTTAMMRALPPSPMVFGVAVKLLSSVADAVAPESVSAGVCVLHW
ncbi:MAG: hypothetical protein Q9P14_03700 [candidate division KSB1 bacterium]|nr:hypothetical protein [candidate division KSB1 bacterium]